MNIFCQFRERNNHYSKPGISKLFLYRQLVNILGFEGHKVPVATLHNVAVITQKQPQTIRKCMNVAASIKLYLQKKQAILSQGSALNHTAHMEVQMTVVNSKHHMNIIHATSFLTTKELLPNKKNLV